VIKQLRKIIVYLSYRTIIFHFNNIVNIAAEELRSQARIQVHDFAQILANRLESIIPLLQTLADSPVIQNNEFRRAQTIIDYRKTIQMI
jgi:hypothetical protein